MGNKRHGTPRTSSHCRAGSKTDACLTAYCMLRLLPLKISLKPKLCLCWQNAGSRQEQAGDYCAGYLPPRSARHVARGSLLGVRPRWRALFIIYRDGVNNNLFTGCHRCCHRTETYYSRVWWNIRGAIGLTCLKNFAHNKNAIYLQGLFPLSVSREVLRCMMNGPSKSVMTSVVSPPTSSYLRSTATPLGTPATAGISSQT